MKERPEEWAYYEYPEDPDELRRELLALQRQQASYLKQIVEGGAWFAGIGFLLACAILAALTDVF